MSKAVIHRLAFDEDHVKPILRGDKWLSLRYGLELGIEPGDRLEMVESDSREAFARATVDLVSTTTPERFVASRAEGHRTYASVHELLDELRGYYPDDTIHPKTDLTLLGWPPNVRPSRAALRGDALDVARSGLYE